MNGRRERKTPGARRSSRARAKPRHVAAVAKDALVQAVAQRSRDGRDTRVVELMDRRALLVAARRLLRQHTDRCTTCGSSFITHEPAFVHCHYCGRMHRVANASLMEQELFEIRLGLRLAS